MLELREIMRYFDWHADGMKSPMDNELYFKKFTLKYHFKMSDIKEQMRLHNG
jgi:hypothetical protein